MFHLYTSHTIFSKFKCFTYKKVKTCIMAMKEITLAITRRSSIILINNGSSIPVFEIFIEIFVLGLNMAIQSALKGALDCEVY